MVEDTACHCSFHQCSAPWAAIEDGGHFPIINHCSPQCDRLGFAPKQWNVTAVALGPVIWWHWLARILWTLDCGLRQNLGFLQWGDEGFLHRTGKILQNRSLGRCFLRRKQWPAPSCSPWSCSCWLGTGLQWIRLSWLTRAPCAICLHAAGIQQKPRDLLQNDSESECYLPEWGRETRHWIPHTITQGQNMRLCSIFCFFLAAVDHQSWLTSLWLDIAKMLTGLWCWWTRSACPHCHLSVGYRWPWRTWVNYPWMHAWFPWIACGWMSRVALLPLDGGFRWLAPTGSLLEGKGLEY